MHHANDARESASARPRTSEILRSIETRVNYIIWKPHRLILSILPILMRVNRSGSYHLQTLFRLSPTAIHHEQLLNNLSGDKLENMLLGLTEHEKRSHMNLYSGADHDAVSRDPAPNGLLDNSSPDGHSRVDRGTRSHLYNTFTHPALTDDISLDLSAWNLTMENDCSLHNASRSESAANLSHSGRTVDPRLLSVFDEFNEVADESSLTTDFLGAGTTGYPIQPVLARAYPAFDKTLSNAQAETFKHDILRIRKGLVCGCGRAGYTSKRAFKVRQRDSCQGRGPPSG